MSRVIERIGLIGLLLLTIAGTGIGLFLAINRQNSTQLSAQDTQIEISYPEVDPNSVEQSQVSPEGTQVLWLHTQDLGASRTEMRLSIEDGETGVEELIYSEVIIGDFEHILPFNTWSPDNRYFFLRRLDGRDRYLVFKADGSTFGEYQYLDVSDFYEQAEIEYDLVDVTGWASPTLLLVLTNEPGTNEAGPSFWFDVTTNNFIRLTTQF